MSKWDEVREAIPSAKAIIWDGCHKIYLAMDDGQVSEFKALGYDYILPTEGLRDATVLTVARSWFEASCCLRFVEGVRTVSDGGNPNEGFETLIGQD